MKPLEIFWMVGLHTRPENTICELQRLEDVYKALPKPLGSQDPPQRVVFIGDFNADCNYFKEYDKMKIPFLFKSNYAGMYMLPFKEGARTNVIGDKKCIYDRIVVSKSLSADISEKFEVEVGTFEVCSIMYMPYPQCTFCGGGNRVDRLKL